jgi:hypothetical protein
LSDLQPAPIGSYSGYFLSSSSVLSFSTKNL